LGNGRRACRRERNGQGKSKSQHRINHLDSPRSGERECRQVGNSMNREELPPISGAAQEISPAIGAPTNQWPRLHFIVTPR
jgi:hypothetical protein